ncbi:MAG: hypothetical protein ACHQSE_00575 [Gemmatimonadales bacterium]
MAARARGILGMAITWGVGLAGFATTLLVGGVMLGVVPGSIFGIRELVAVAARAFIVGGGAGALFALVVARRARADNFDTLRLRSFGAWGFTAAAGAAAMLAIGMPGSLPATILIPSILLAGTLGAGAAAGMLVIARRGVKQVREWREDSNTYLPP